MLREFISEHRDDILARAGRRVAQRSAPVATEEEVTQGLPVFLDQLRESLRRASLRQGVDHSEIQRSAGEHGDALFHRGATVAQVVHDYGDLCQVITGLAVETSAPIATEEFQTLNLCLDDAIAGAVARFAQERERAISNEGTERLGVLAREMRNLVGAAMISFANIKKGIVAPGGSTAAIHDRSLTRLNSLIDRSLASVRLDAGLQNLERVPVREVIEEVEISASMFAQGRKVLLSVTSVDPTVVVLADRQILAAAVANLLQNAFKFTHPGSTVRLAASSSTSRVLIEVEDECGGLPKGTPETLLRPFVQRGTDRTGLGLGLSICMQAAKAFGGELRVRDLPGQGCVFTLDLPKQSPPAAAIEPCTPKAGINGGPPATKKANALTRVWARFMPLSQ
jgi:signal transduction histidine kinase